jgi:hypothetical protein
MRGLGKFIESSANTGGAGASSDIPDDYKTPAASINVQAAAGDITESEFNTIIRSIYRANGEANNLVLIADTTLRKQIADYARFGVDLSKL